MSNIYIFNTEQELLDYLSINIINTNEAAEMLGCTRQYIDKLVKQGKLRTIKIYPTNKLFMKSDVEARTKKPAPE